MYIERIELRNYRGHEHIEVRFNPGMTVIAGVNGAGKSSLLHGIFDALTCAVPNLTMDEAHRPFGEAGYAHAKVFAPSGRVRFEDQYPVEVTADARVQGSGPLRWTIRSSALGGMGYIGASPSDWIWSKAQEESLNSTATEWRAVPVIAYYRASRAWQSGQIDEIGTAMERNSRGDGYEGWWHAGLTADALQRWIVAKSLERLQVAVEAGGVASTDESDELGQINRALRMSLESFESIRYDLPSKRVVIGWLEDQGQRRVPVAFEHLSAGQRAVICLIGDIARRMCLLNPQFGDGVIGETEGVVLIDELDMHLHPEWQRALTRGLTRAFPKVQFIVASHSPQVIGEVPHQNVILLTPDGPVNPQGSFGMTSNQVLQELMDAEVQATSVKKKLDEIGEALTRNELDEAELKIRDLASEAPELRELAGAEALLKRKRTIGR